MEDWHNFTKESWSSLCIVNTIHVWHNEWAPCIGWEKERKKRGEVKQNQENGNSIQSLWTEEEAEYNKDVNRMLTAANCMMKGPQLSMEEAHIHIRERGMWEGWLGLRVSCGWLLVGGAGTSRWGEKEGANPDTIIEENGNSIQSLWTEEEAEYKQT